MDFFIENLFRRIRVVQAMTEQYMILTTVVYFYFIDDAFPKEA